MASRVYCELLGRKWLLGPSIGETSSWYQRIMDRQIEAPKGWSYSQDGGQLSLLMFARSASLPHGSAASVETAKMEPGKIQPSQRRRKGSKREKAGVKGNRIFFVFIIPNYSYLTFPEAMLFRYVPKTQTKTSAQGKAAL